MSPRRRPRSRRPTPARISSGSRPSRTPTSLLVDCRIDRGGARRRSRRRSRPGAVRRGAPRRERRPRFRCRAADRPVLVPFGGAEHDWAAVEVAAWIARASGASLLLAGAEGDPGLGKRDASRSARERGAPRPARRRVATEPLLVPRGPRGHRSRGRPTPGWSSWASPASGARRASARPASRSPGTPPARPCSSGAACGREAWRRGESLTRFTWSLPASTARSARLSPLSGLSAASQRRRRPCRHGTLDHIRSGGGSVDPRHTRDRRHVLADDERLQRGHGTGAKRRSRVLPLAERAALRRHLPAALTRLHPRRTRFATGGRARR